MLHIAMAPDLAEHLVFAIGSHQGFAVQTRRASDPWLLTTDQRLPGISYAHYDICQPVAG
jgi:hypothetical protein